MKLLGIDSGGTFTDFVVYDDGQLIIHKCLSTPDAPERAIIQGLRDLGLSDSEDAADAIEIAHGTTAATNAVLERKGARTAYVTNRGFADTLTIGRQNRDAIYHLTPTPQPPPVPRELCFETGGRLAADGAVVDDLNAEDIDALLRQLEATDIEAVAINLLFSFVDARFERALEAALTERFAQDLFISRSSAVLPEYREYERGIATWLNSYTGPVLRRYIDRLQAKLRGVTIRLMQSDGCTVGAKKVGDYAARMLLSGPAGGVIAMHRIGRSLDRAKLLGFDMGGTSTDVSMVDGDIELTDKGRIDRYPIAVPMIDIHTIGSGGGSIAYLDAGGLLRVGPESAGAHPGPACYGRGGQRATVTDANYILGRLPEKLGETIPLDRDAAEAALQPIADGINGTIEDAARGIVDVVNERMIQALKVMSVHRGKDPRDCLLFGFGAAGGLHVCALADGLQIKEAIVPARAGVFSALGMLLASQGMNKSRTVCVVTDRITNAELDARFDALDDLLTSELRELNIARANIKHHIDLRYAGQAQCLRLPRAPLANLADDFRAAYERLYNYALDLPVEIVTLRAAAEGQSLLDWDAIPAEANAERELGAGAQTILSSDCTIYIAENWTASRDAHHHIHLRRLP